MNRGKEGGGKEGQRKGGMEREVWRDKVTKDRRGKPGPGQDYFGEFQDLAVPLSGLGLQVRWVLTTEAQFFIGVLSWGHTR